MRGDLKTALWRFHAVVLTVADAGLFALEVVAQMYLDKREGQK